MRQHHDLHSALVTEEMESAEGEGVQFKLVKLQSSKDDIWYTVHANPTTFSFSGPQRGGFLKYLGFKQGNCAFLPGGECLASEVKPDFSVADFAGAFALAFPALEEADKKLGNCGYPLTHLDNIRSIGDGHTAPKRKRMKESDDDNFIFVMSWIEGGSNKGWTFHYRPNHPPISEEMAAAFEFLKLKEFGECPIFDFEPCHWRFFAFEQSGDGFLGRNTEFVHRCFDAHKENFSVGIENLLKIHSLLRPFGFNFLPQVRASAFTTQRQVSPQPERPSAARSPEPRTFEFDVAVSFAGTERDHAERLSSLVRDAGFNVFYDYYYPEQLWGKDLVVFFDDIYRKKSRYCVSFISKEYVERMWTTHERKSAQARMIDEKGNEYILPIMVDGTELPGMAPTIGYLGLDEYGIDEIARILIDKLKP